MTEPVPIADIQIPQGREPRRNVRILAESIEKVGLLNPITVRTIQLFEAGAEPRDGYRLVAGRNRLEAMKQLGHMEIPATIVTLEDLEYRLAEFDENLIRSDIPVIDQGDRLEEHKQIWEAMYPETGWGKAKKNNGNSKVGKFPTFSDSASAKIGLSPAAVRLLVKVGKLSDDIKDLVRGTPLGDNQNELLKLARIKDHNEQRTAALAYISGERDTITVPKKRGPTKTERQQRAEKSAEIIVKYIPADLLSDLCKNLQMDKATMTVAAIRKAQKTKSP